jgi:hypothetical protein
MKEVCLFYSRLVYFIALWSFLRPFGLFCDHLVYIFYGYLVNFSRFGMLYQEKSGNPGEGGRKTTVWIRFWNSIRVSPNFLKIN